MYIDFLIVSVVRETLYRGQPSRTNDERRASVKFINKTRRVITELALGSFYRRKFAFKLRQPHFQFVLQCFSFLSN